MKLLPLAIVAPIAPAVLAQVGIGAGADAVGASGWASFGIAGLVLSWLLLKHLPAKDAQVMELISIHDDKLAQTVAAFTSEQQALRISYDRHLTDERTTCEARHKELLGELRQVSVHLQSIRQLTE